MELTRKRALKLHRQLWNWLADNPQKDKDNWPEWEGNGGKIEYAVSGCPACEFAIMNFADVCPNCPLVWPGLDCLHDKEDSCDGLFYKWDRTDYELHPRKRTNLARKIANLPERKEA